MIRHVASALVLCASAAAFAGDPPKPPAAKPAPAHEMETPSGFKAEVKLNNGHSMSGVIRAAGTWERKDKEQGWVACGKDEPGACIRLWYVAGGEGFLVVAGKDVKSVDDNGALADGDIKRITGQAAASEKRAEEERERLRKEREARKAAEAKAAAEAPKVDNSPEAKKRAELAAAADKRAAELLAKFPPKDWSPERRDEIQKRALIIKVMPTTEEREFLDNFNEWVRAAADAAAKDAVKEAAAKAAAAKAGADAKPEAPKPGDDKKDKKDKKGDGK